MAPKKITVTRHAPANTIRDDFHTPSERSAFNPAHLAEPEPIMMLTTHEVQAMGGKWTGNNNRRVTSGPTKGAIERRPSVAHRDVDFRKREVAEETRGRYRTMLDANGHEVFIVHSNGAAHAPQIIEGRFSHDGYAAHVLRKDWGTGRIDVNGGCLLRQLRENRVNPRFLLVDLKGETMCAKDAKSCKHLDAERDARRARNLKRMAEVEINAKPEDQKRHEQLMANNDANQSTLVDAVSKLTAIVAELQKGK